MLVTHQTSVFRHVPNYGSLKTDFIQSTLCSSRDALWLVLDPTRSYLAFQWPIPSVSSPLSSATGRNINLPAPTVSAKLSGTQCECCTYFVLNMCYNRTILLSSALNSYLELGEMYVAASLYVFCMAYKHRSYASHRRIQRSRKHRAGIMSVTYYGPIEERCAGAFFYSE